MTSPRPRRAEGFYDPGTYDCEIGTSSARLERRRFYVEAAAHLNGPILELGCGTGDICLAIARTGKNVVGLDSSAEMISAARDKARRLPVRAVWVQARMEAFAFRLRFAAVLVTYHALFHVLSRDELDTLLARIHDHLLPGGVFLADVPTRAPGEPSRRRSASRALTPDGIYHVREEETFDRATRRLHTQFSYQLEQPDSGLVLDRWTRELDYLVTDLDALVHALRDAGFTSVTTFRAFEPGIPVAPGRDAVLQAARPGIGNDG